jgi:hypothetical protein
MLSIDAVGREDNRQLSCDDEAMGLYVCPSSNLIGAGEVGTLGLLEQ